MDFGQLVTWADLARGLHALFRVHCCRALEQNKWFVHGAMLYWINRRKARQEKKSTTPCNVVYPIIYAHYVGDPRAARSPAAGDTNRFARKFHWTESHDTAYALTNLLDNHHYHFRAHERIMREDDPTQPLRIEQKPQSLIAELILRFSDPGDLVVDP